MKNEFPKISCITITKERLVALKAAMDCYCRQTYPERELLIVTDGTPWYRQAIRRYILSLGRNDIRLVETGSEKYTLGKLRNYGISQAQGELVCQWDDDDLYHHDRLKLQAEKIFAENAIGCCLTDQLHYFENTRELFWMDWNQQNVLPVFRLIPGTVMCFKKAAPLYPEYGALASKGEDTEFLKALSVKGPIAALSGQAHLYVYTYHGSNTFSEKHHRTLVQGYALEGSALLEKAPFIYEALRQHRLPSPVRITGRNEQIAFTWA
jgi:hypothetical protein